jgi:hypothetical protein
MRSSVSNFIGNSKQKGDALAGGYGTKGAVLLGGPHLVRKTLI